MARLIVTHGAASGREFHLKTKTTIGRQEGNDIMLAGEAVSRYHAKIEGSGSKFFLEDNNSSNGVFVNGNAIKRCQLKDQDEIQIGEWRLLFYSDKEAEDDNIVGKVIGGYRLIKKLGAGGMGHVFEARQISLDRVVALKILNKRLSMDKDYIKSFFQEARLAAKFNHPNIVQIYDVGDVDFKLFYFSMEMIDGSNLQDILDRDGYVPLPEALNITRQIAEALVCAREHNVVHQDVKPRNVMLTKNGIAKLTDLGLAKVFGTKISDGHKGKILGTPFYMSPEQAQGLEVDYLSDMYSLGASLYHLVTGRPPFEGKTVLAIVAQHLSADVPDPREQGVVLPDLVMKFIRKLMAKKPAERFESFEAVIHAIDTIFSELGDQLYAKRIRAAKTPEVVPVPEAEPLPNTDSIPVAEPVGPEAGPAKNVKPVTFDDPSAPAHVEPVQIPEKESVEAKSKTRPKKTSRAPKKTQAKVKKKADLRSRARIEQYKKSQATKFYISLGVWAVILVVATIFIYPHIKRALSPPAPLVKEKNGRTEKKPEKEVFSPASPLARVDLNMLNAQVTRRFVVETGKLEYTPESKGIIFPQPAGGPFSVVLKTSPFFMGEAELHAEVLFNRGAPFFETCFYQDDENFVRVTFNGARIVVSVRHENRDVNVDPVSFTLLENEKYKFTIKFKSNRMYVSVNGHEELSKHYAGFSKMNVKLRVISVTEGYTLTGLELVDNQ